MWLQVRAINKGTAHLARPRIWATGHDLERLGRCRHHWAWARTFFAVACAAVFALRVGDVSSFTWDGITTPRFITFWDQKVNAEWITMPLSPFLERWRDYIHRFRRPDQLTTTLFPATLWKVPPAPTSRGPHGSGSRRRRTSGLGAPLWASSSGPDGDRPGKPATTPATPQRGRSQAPYAYPTLPGTLDHRPETSTTASSPPRSYGHRKLGHQSHPERSAQ